MNGRRSRRYAAKVVPRDGLGEADVAGEVGVAADGRSGGCGGVARGPGREQRQLVDMGHLSQQLRIVGAAHSGLFEEARVTQLICRSRSAIDCSIRLAVASAFSDMPSVSDLLMPR